MIKMKFFVRKKKKKLIYLRKNTFFARIKREILIFIWKICYFKRKEVRHGVFL